MVMPRWIYFTWMNTLKDGILAVIWDKILQRAIMCWSSEGHVGGLWYKRAIPSMAYAANILSFKDVTTI